MHSPTLLSAFTAVSTVLARSNSHSKKSLSDCVQEAVTCLRINNIAAYLNGDAAFPGLELPFNVRLNYTPAVIVTPSSADEVSRAVKCAAAGELKVQARSGGHSYASFSTGGQNGSFIVDLTNFNNVTVDSANKNAVISGGVRLGNLDLALFAQGERTISHGTCPGIGVGGHMTHGGYGHSSRKWGIALDSIIGLEVVKANGDIVFVTGDNTTTPNDPDLFWAMRGAADSFGIVTAFHVKTEVAPKAVINWGFSLVDPYTNRDTFIQNMLHIQAFATNSSVINRNISFGCYLDGKVFNVAGMYFGDAAYFNSSIVPELARSLASQIIPNPGAQTADWISSMILLGGAPTIFTPLPRTGYTLHDNFFAKSLTIPEASPFTATALGSYYDYIAAKGINPPNPWFSIINLYGGPDSQINNKDTSFAAYSDRESLWVIQHYGHTNATVPTVDLDFVNGLNEAITSAMPGVPIGAYLNYIDPSLTREEAVTLYYGEKLYERLAGLKKTYDPNNLFWNPLAVEAAA